MFFLLAKKGIECYNQGIECFGSGKFGYATKVGMFDSHNRLLLAISLLY